MPHAPRSETSHAQPRRATRGRTLALLSAALLALAACGGPRPVAETWDNGRQMRQGQLVSGKQQGEWRYWYDNGQPQAHGSWRDDKQHGEWTYWWPTGQLQSEGAYGDNGRRDGTWRQYHENGQLASVGDYRRDRQEGLWRYWDAEGRPFAEGAFLAGVKAGLWRTHGADGAIASEGLYYLGLRVGPWRQPQTGEAGSATVDLGVPGGFIAAKRGADGDVVGAWGMSRATADSRVFAFPIAGVDGMHALTRADGSRRVALEAAGRGFAAAWHANGAIACAGSTLAGAKDGAWRYWSADGGELATVAFTRGEPAAMDDASASAVLAIERAAALGFDASDAAPAVTAPAAEPVPAPTVAATPRADDELSPFASAPAAVVAAPSAAPTSVPAPVPASDAQLDLPLAGASATPGPSLSPMPMLASFWTKLEEANAQRFIQRYDTGTAAADPIDDPYAADTSVVSQRPDLIGKPLAQTRFLDATGDVLDLADYRTAKKPVVVVLLRGFSGQVCIYCATQTAALAKRMQEFRAAGAEVVVVYPGPADSAPAFVQAVKSLGSEAPPMPVALDVSLLLVRALDVEDNLARPTSLVLDGAGKVRFAYVGKTIADRPSADDLLREVRRLVE